MSVSTSGFALRINGTCPVNDVDCGATVEPYRVCCPANSFCPTQYNDNCCPTSANCTEILLQNPQCANQSWNLYDNSGYFYCEQGFTGYASTTDSDGCAVPGYAFQSGEVLLPIISTGIAISTTASSLTLTSSTSSPTTIPTSPAKNSNTGSIAGGVVGGVLVLAVIISGIFWFIVRRKRSRITGEQTTYDELAELPHKDHKDSEASRAEVTSQQGVSELAEHGKANPGELWDPHAVSELA